MKKNIIISALLILFAIGCSVCAGEIKFVQVSDVHYSNENEYSKKAGSKGTRLRKEEIYIKKHYCFICL